MRKKKSDDLVFGRWPVKEALENATVSKVLISKNADRKELGDLMDLLNKKRVQYVWSDKKRMDKLVRGNHQGVIAYVSPVEFTSLSAVLKKASAMKKGVGVIFLDGVQDPQNLGAILRSAAFFGVAGVIIPRWRGVGVTGTVVKTSAGAAHMVPIVQATNLAQALEAAKEAGLWIVGTDMEGEDLKSADIPRPVALVMGSEGKGMNRLTREKCDFLVKMSGDPDRSGIDSLNVSACCAAALYHLY